jgi:hypothetical protein
MQECIIYIFCQHEDSPKEEEYFTFVPCKLTYTMSPLETPNDKTNPILPHTYVMK